MKKLLLILALAALAPHASAQPAAALSALADLARSHEQVFKHIAGEQVALVLQKGEKQFVVYGVTQVRAVGSALEVTVKQGQKYSVNPGDVFFLTNDTFGLK
ncbi:MAG TPA: hypothetical protein VEQ65_00860 [Opitutus sp.]|nr:hypothetical protein [Opitutus sp.]